MYSQLECIILDGVTEQSTEIAAQIRSGKIGINVLGDELFESYLGVESDVVAAQIGNQIYIRSSSATLFSDVVHEGTHALDFLSGVDQSIIGSWEGEMRAYIAERLFQITADLPVEYEDIIDLIYHVRHNYPK